MVPLGAFAGSRGRALPVTALILELTGRTDVQFVVEALFLNSPILKMKGTRVVLAGPTGREPMIGLRINMETLAAADPGLAAPSSAPKQPSTATQSPRKTGTTSRVKVFRSRPKP